MCYNKASKQTEAGNGVSSIHSFIHSYERLRETDKEGRKEGRPPLLRRPRTTSPPHDPRRPHPPQRARALPPLPLPLPLPILQPPFFSPASPSFPLPVSYFRFFHTLFFFFGPFGFRLHLSSSAAHLLQLPLRGTVGEVVDGQGGAREAEG